MKTILVVDDDKMNLNNALKILSPTYKVVPVPGGKVALNYLQKGKPDLILLDVLMPDMDGFAVMEQLQANPEKLGDRKPVTVAVEELYHDELTLEYPKEYTQQG